MLILMMGVVGITEGQESTENIEFDAANVKPLCVTQLVSIALVVLGIIGFVRRVQYEKTL